MFEESRTFGEVETEHTFSSLRITPLIDIVFLLLIFFMVSTTFTVQPGLQIDLPGAGGEVELPEDQYVVSLTERGEIYLGEAIVDLEGLARELDQTDKPVTVRADRRVPHGHIVRVLDTIREAGVRRVNLSTRPIEEEEDE